MKIYEFTVVIERDEFFPLEDVRTVRYEEGALVLTFHSRPADAPRDSDRGRFVYERVDEAEGKAFEAAFRWLRSR